MLLIFLKFVRKILSPCTKRQGDPCRLLILLNFGKEALAGLSSCSTSFARFKIHLTHLRAPNEVEVHY